MHSTKFARIGGRFSQTFHNSHHHPVVWVLFSTILTMTRRTLRRTRRSSRRKERSHRVVGDYEDENGPIARGGVACPFPWRLHDMLAYTEEQNLEDVVSWDEEGNGFSVYETDSFVKQILPR